MSDFYREIPTIPTTSEVLAEALALSGEILKDIELSRTKLSLVALKASRLARLLNEFDVQEILQWESSGYPVGISGVSTAVSYTHSPSPRDS